MFSQFPNHCLPFPMVFLHVSSVFLQFPQVFLKLPLSVSPFSYFIFCVINICFSFLKTYTLFSLWILSVDLILVLLTLSISHLVLMFLLLFLFILNDNFWYNITKFNLNFQNKVLKRCF